MVKQVWIPTPGGLLVICQSVSIQYILLDSVLLILWFLSVLEVLSGDTFYWFIAIYIGGIRRFLYSVSSVIWFGFILWGCDRPITTYAISALPLHDYLLHAQSSISGIIIICTSMPFLCHCRVLSAIKYIIKLKKGRINYWI